VLACSAEPRCLPGAKISSYIEDVEAVYPRPGLILCLLMPLLHLLDAAIHGKEHEEATVESSVDGGRRESGSATLPPAAVHDHPRWKVEAGSGTAPCPTSPSRRCNPPEGPCPWPLSRLSGRLISVGVNRAARHGRRHHCMTTTTGGYGGSGQWAGSIWLSCDGG
jgi:hypothetical protein